MAVQFKVIGTPLFKATGIVAMDPNCCCGGCDFMMAVETFHVESVPLQQIWFAAPGEGARTHDSYNISWENTSQDIPILNSNLVDGYEIHIGSFISRKVTFHESTLVGDISEATLTERFDLNLSLIYRTSPSPGFRFKISNQEVSYGGPALSPIGSFPIVGSSSGTSPTPWVWGTPPITYPNLPNMPYSPTFFPADFETSLVSLFWATATSIPCS